MSKVATSRQERLNGNQPENNETLFAGQQQEQQPDAATAAAAAAAAAAAEQEKFGEHDSPENLDFNKPFQNMNFDELESKEGQEMTGNFLSLETINDGKPHNYFVVGHTTFTDNTTGDTRPAVKLVGKGEKGNINYICGATVVVKTCAEISEYPKPIRIIVNGKTKGANGAYWNAQVFAL